jgi:hypothetical protein
MSLRDINDPKDPFTDGDKWERDPLRSGVATGFCRHCNREFSAECPRCLKPEPGVATQELLVLLRGPFDRLNARSHHPRDEILVMVPMELARRVLAEWSEENAESGKEPLDTAGRRDLT